MLVFGRTSPAYLKAAHSESYVAIRGPHPAPRAAGGRMGSLNEPFSSISFTISIHVEWDKRSGAAARPQSVCIQYRADRSSTYARN